MIRFDWKRFCTRYRIDFVTSGPNTARGNISIHCPWCGPADPSEHLGLKLDVRDPQWGCFRNSAHKGKTPQRLVARLLGVSMQQAEAIVQEARPPVDSLGDVLHALKHGPDAPEQPQALRGSLRVPETFRPLGDAQSLTNHYAARFLDYLAGRGFGDADAFDAAALYKLWYAVSGEQAWRLVFPVYSDAGQLFGWTGREIRHRPRIRYKAREEMGKDWLLTSPRKEPAHVLVICEGPIDFLKIDYYGRRYGVEAVGTMGTAVTEAQLMQIMLRMRRYKRTYSLFDLEAYAQGFRLCRDASGSTGTALFQRVPVGYEDPGALSKLGAMRFCAALSR